MGHRREHRSSKSLISLQLRRGSYSFSYSPLPSSACFRERERESKNQCQTVFFVLRAFLIILQGIQHSTAVLFSRPQNLDFLPLPLTKLSDMKNSLPSNPACTLFPTRHPYLSSSLFQYSLEPIHQNHSVSTVVELFRRWFCASPTLHDFALSILRTLLTERQKSLFCA